MGRRVAPSPSPGKHRGEGGIYPLFVRHLVRTPHAIWALWAMFAVLVVLSVLGLAAEAQTTL